MAVTIRAATADDILSLVALMTDFYAEANFPLSPAAASAAFHSLLAKPQLGAIWLAETDLSVAGHVVLTLSFSMEWGGLRGCIDDLYVRPEARGQGIAAALLAAVRSTCDERGVRALIVEVGPDNLPARRLYARSGFLDRRNLLLELPLSAPMHAS